MTIRRRPVASGIRAIALLAVSITITATIATAMLIDTLTAPALTIAAPMPILKSALHGNECVLRSAPRIRQGVCRSLVPVPTGTDR